jgi:hypothetical protein
LGILEPVKGDAVSPVVEVIMWLLIPVLTTFGAWFYLRAKGKADVNAQLGIVDTDLQRMRQQLGKFRNDD